MAGSLGDFFCIKSRSLLVVDWVAGCLFGLPLPRDFANERFVYVVSCRIGALGQSVHLAESLVVEFLKVVYFGCYLGCVMCSCGCVSSFPYDWALLVCNP